MEWNWKTRNPGPSNNTTLYYSLSVYSIRAHPFHESDTQGVSQFSLSFTFSTLFNWKNMFLFQFVINARFERSRVRGKIVCVFFAKIKKKLLKKKEKYFEKKRCFENIFLQFENILCFCAILWIFWVFFFVGLCWTEHEPMLQVKSRFGWVTSTFFQRIIDDHFAFFSVSVLVLHFIIFCFFSLVFYSNFLILLFLFSSD